MTSAQDIASAAPAYCSELKRVAALAMTKEKFAAIAGKPRQGNFRDTDLALTGWRDCSLYGAGNLYLQFPGARPPRRTPRRRKHGPCMTSKPASAKHGAEARDRSSPRYVVLHHAGPPLSITLSTDQTDKNEHVVRLILFVRRN